ncbi:hypothetical protein IFT37_18615 [Pseudomonas fluorescens]|uniref:Uncharacterized protein n=1 Tax=Pseudomonas fluorescens TaxID=294 RepID=A0AAE2U3W4_PSEFL|nr:MULTISPECIES: hypothetical protein [Pseudomonas fluorescens group]MBA1427988.1 hypothetical protein [Pseudomonas orientalis]MBD8147965.1 hypothetical protein [Pseudomonas fluorescens]MBD8177863.1 hypothetical protein [Pseudomonas fluorescens]MBD8270485.1 hypothetical protein [Pseudomonas fluorescens]MBD8747124.1 hypothetical protein [Pseudomonas fluorescens]
MKGTIAIDAQGDGQAFYGKFKREPVLVTNEYRVYELADFYLDRDETIEVVGSKSGRLLGKYRQIAIVGAQEPKHYSMVEAWAFDSSLRQPAKNISYRAIFFDFDA